MITNVRRRFRGQRLSIKFLLSIARQSVNHEPLPADATEQWSIGGQELSVDVYLPRAGKKVRGSMLMLHGMNALGGRDPRMLALCRILLELGFIAVVPSFPTITDYQINPRQCDDMQQVIARMLIDKKLCPSGRLSIFSASFSGGISIRAAAMSAHADKINAVLSIGVFSDCQQGLMDLIAPTCEDTYAHLIGVLNMYRRAKVDDANLMRALVAAIHDEFTLIDDSEHLQRCLADVLPSEKDRLTNMVDDIVARRFVVPEEIVAKARIPELAKQFSYEGLVKDVQFKIFVIQDVDDKILPAKHAIALRDYTQQHGLKHRFIVTPLLSHANVQLNFKNLNALWGAVNTVGQFFTCAMV